LYLSFFFSSRRRHTRCYRDWSSDVCSSDLDDVDFTFAETERGLERFNQARTIFLVDRDAILNDLNPGAESLDFFRIVIHADDFVVNPNAEISLLLEELEKRSWFGFGRNCHPKCDQHAFISAVAQNCVSD